MSVGPNDSLEGLRPDLPRRRLGQTDLYTSVLGMGSSPFRNGSPSQCADLLTQAFDLGINYYDTARSYVNGEEAVAVLPPRVRDELIVTTKTGARGGIHCVRQLHESLRAMSRGHIDVWMTHMVETEREYEMCTELGGFCDIAASSKAAGLIRASGASFHAPTHVILRAIEERAFDVVMFPLNLIGRETVIGASIASYRDTLLPAARKNGVGVIVMKALVAGQIRHGADRLGFVESNFGVGDVVGGSLRWACRHPEISSTVVGVATTQELIYDVFAASGVGDGDRAECDRVFDRVRALQAGPCTRCGDCVGTCPHDVEIPQIFRLYDQHRYLGLRGSPTAGYRVLDVDATACASCRQCEVACPESFDIPDLLAESHRALHRPQGDERRGSE